MKKEILPILQCPNSGEKLELIVNREFNDEIYEGIVKSSTNEYPIENGVINFLDPKDTYIQQEIMHNYSTREELEKKMNKDELQAFLVKEALGLTEADYYDEYTRNTMDEILGALNLKNSNILEIGGSSGRDLIKYFGNNNNMCFEMDINPFLYESSSILMKHNNFHYERIRQDMNKLPFEDNSFDLVFGSATFHHIDNPDICFKEVFRILKPNGIFYVLNERTLSILKPELKEVVALELEFAHEHTFFASEWKKFLKEAGFEVNCIRPNYYSYSRILNRIYGKGKPKTGLGRLKYFYYKLFSLLNINNNNFIMKLIQRIEDHYLGNVPFNAIAKK